MPWVKLFAALALVWALISAPTVWRLIREAFGPTHGRAPGRAPMGDCFRCGRTVYAGEPFIAREPRRRADFQRSSRGRLLSHARCSV